MLSYKCGPQWHAVLDNFGKAVPVWQLIAMIGSLPVSIHRNQILLYLAVATPHPIFTEYYNLYFNKIVLPSSACSMMILV